MITMHARLEKGPKPHARKTTQGRAQESTNAGEPLLEFRTTSTCTHPPPTFPNMRFFSVGAVTKKPLSSPPPISAIPARGPCLLQQHHQRLRESGALERISAASRGIPAGVEKLRCEGLRMSWVVWRCRV